MKLQVSIAAFVLLTGGCQWGFTSSVSLMPGDEVQFLEYLDSEIDLGVEPRTLADRVDTVPESESIIVKVDVSYEGVTRTVRLEISRDEMGDSTLRFTALSWEFYTMMNEIIDRYPNVVRKDT